MAEGLFKTSEQLLPWVPAQPSTGFSLYWMPVRCYPTPAAQRSWIMNFRARLMACQTVAPFRHEVFFKASATDPELIAFLSRLPVSLHASIGIALGAAPEAVQHCYRFLGETAVKAQIVFFGRGGMADFFIQPVAVKPMSRMTIPNALKANPVFGQLFSLLDIDQIQEQVAGMIDGFQAKTMELYGDKIRNEPRARGAQFVIPWPSSAELFTGTEEDKQRWFQLFEVLLIESPADEGLLLVSKTNLDSEIIAILAQMRHERLTYDA